MPPLSRMETHRKMLDPCLQHHRNFDTKSWSDSVLMQGRIVRDFRNFHMTLPLLDTLQEITNSLLLDVDRTNDIPIAKEFIGPISTTNTMSVDLVNLDLKLIFNRKKRSSTSRRQRLRSRCRWPCFRTIPWRFRSRSLGGPNSKGQLGLSCQNHWVAGIGFLLDPTGMNNTK